MNILVLGASGMAGHMVVRYLREKNYNVTDAARSYKNKIDVTDTDSIRKIMTLQSWDYVINCIGVLVQESKNNPDKAILVNGWFPHYLESLTKDTKTRIIHLSTDCVFSGSKGNYTETDIHDAVDYYGKSKSIGELNNTKDITFRMSIIGPEINQSGTGLLHWFLNNNSNEIPGWDNAYWNGITTLQLAKCIEKYILNPQISGIYHVVSNQNSINKYELLLKINNIFKTEKNIVRTQGPKLVNKVLKDTKCSFDFEIPDYDTMLTELYNYNKKEVI